MAKKKVIDADVMRNRLPMLAGKSYSSSYMNGGYSSGNYDIDNAMRMMNQAIASQVATSINQAFTIFVYDLIQIVDEAERDEHDGMCGLCRTDPDDMFPTDYRPK